MVGLCIDGHICFLILCDVHDREDGAALLCSKGVVICFFLGPVDVDHC